MSKTVFGYQACRNPHSYSLYTDDVSVCAFKKYGLSHYPRDHPRQWYHSSCIPTISEKDREGRKALIWGRKLIKAGTLVRGNSA